MKIMIPPEGGLPWLLILSKTEVVRAPALSGANGNSSICNEIADPARIADRTMTAGRDSVVIRWSITETY